MRRWLSIPLMLLYFITSTGMVVNVHYCSNEISSVQINTSATCCCDDSNTNPDNDCCEDQQIQASTTDQLINQHISFLFSPELIDSFNSLFYHKVVPSTELVGKIAQPHGPPIEGKRIPLYKLYGSLVYYS